MSTDESSYPVLNGGFKTQFEVMQKGSCGASKGHFVDRSKLPEVPFAIWVHVPEFSRCKCGGRRYMVCLETILEYTDKFNLPVPTIPITVCSSKGRLIE